MFDPYRTHPLCAPNGPLDRTEPTDRSDPIHPIHPIHPAKLGPLGKVDASTELGAPILAASRRLCQRLPVLPFCAEAMVRAVEQNGALWHLFDARDVPRFFAQEKYTCFYWHDASGAHEHLLADSLDALERRLGAHAFVRVHRGELVNLRFLRHVSLHKRRGRRPAQVRLELADGQCARVSRRRLPQLRHTLKALGPATALPSQLGVRPLPV